MGDDKVFQDPTVEPLSRPPWFAWHTVYDVLTANWGTGVKTQPKEAHNTIAISVVFTGVEPSATPTGAVSCIYRWLSETCFADARVIWFC